MLENKRTFERFDLPLIVKFRPVRGAASYSLGLTKNLSCEGIGLEARNFNFIVNENLELELKLPQNAASVSLLGNVVWKRQDGKTSYAGIAFNAQNKKTHNETMEKISSYTNIPLSGARYSKKGDKKTGRKAHEEIPVTKPDEILSKHVIKPPEEKSLEKIRKFSFSKQYIKEGAECNVSFVFPREAVPDAVNITIVGDFNNWDTSESPMKRLNNGDFYISLNLPCGKEYRFRYLIDGTRWENDWYADKYVPNSFGSDDSVVVV